ncbi:MAG: glycogen/starch synthase [Prevotella sp.]|uniref:glycogen/starch synthase n=1 Tax=Prevotella sp. TaxID=59823 RepID=UPI0025EE12D9|nr:glycogen/starch synthase [Prevotella sp.]MCI7119674.1 glycogen/starch synthase [Prevotella sp.]
MKKDRLFPDYIFESSWEVCNKVGGIYAVLSTRAKTLKEKLGDNLIFIGPDCWGENKCPYIEEDTKLLKAWKEQAASEGLNVKVGRWNIPGTPVAILVDFKPFFDKKNEIYADMWNKYNVDSLHAYGDYDEASMFSYAAALVVESYYNYYISKKKRANKTIYHANEWMTGLGALYINDRLPQIATIFTTHATSIGRSIAGNNKPLYEYLEAYNGDQMAVELNMESKQSLEKQTAAHVDCFTTVSEITARECAELLDKPVDVVLPNGFEDDFVPQGKEFDIKREAARKRLLDITRALTGDEVADDAVIISTSGRYEWRNKGIDVFIEAVNRLRLSVDQINNEVVAFIEVPAWVNSKRDDLAERLEKMANGEKFDTPLDTPVITHWLNEQQNDRALGMMNWLGIHNQKGEKVKLVFIPCYLTGDDGIVNLSYFDVILGNDLCIYPSYYEPWGYTPLEAVAFKVPCVTTDLAGFGLWAHSECGGKSTLDNGVEVIHRTDYNYNDVAEDIKQTVIRYANATKNKQTRMRNNARALSQKALWTHFIEYYYNAYDFALRKAEARKE